LHKKYFLLAFLFTILLLSACNEADTKSFPDIFIGKWDLDYPDANGYDIWTKINDTLFNGKSFADKQVLFEEMILLKANNNWHLIIQGFQENNTDIVQFDLIKQTKKAFIFENVRNDFPQQIEYKFRSNKSLVVILKNKSKLHEIYFKLNN
jgi:hypothetical protein